MLKIFFNRTSFLVYLLNFLSGLGACLLLYRYWKETSYDFSDSITFFLIFTWLFFNLINWIPWYGRQAGKLGIRLHLQKNIVPLVYLLSLAFSLKIIGLGNFYLLPFAILFLPVYYVSLILLYFHFKDDSDLPVSYFSHNFYLKDEIS